MPTYNYRCRTCDSRFDVVQSMRDAALTVCPTEGGPSACTAPGRGEVAKVFGTVGITFKGSGFYKTDSRAASGRKSGNGSDRKAPAKADSTTGSSGSSGSGGEGASGSSSGPSGDSSASGSSKASGASASSSGSD